MPDTNATDRTALTVTLDNRSTDLINLFRIICTCSHGTAEALGTRYDASAADSELSLIVRVLQRAVETHHNKTICRCSGDWLARLAQRNTVMQMARARLFGRPFPPSVPDQLMALCDAIQADYPLPAMGPP